MNFLRSFFSFPRSGSKTSVFSPSSNLLSAFCQLFPRTSIPPYPILVLSFNPPIPFRLFSALNVFLVVVSFLIHFFSVFFFRVRPLKLNRPSSEPDFFFPSVQGFFAVLSHDTFCNTFAFFLTHFPFYRFLSTSLFPKGEIYPYPSLLAADLLV